MAVDNLESRRRDPQYLKITEHIQNMLYTTSTTKTDSCVIHIPIEFKKHIGDMGDMPVYMFGGEYIFPIIYIQGNDINDIAFIETKKGS